MAETLFTKDGKTCPDKINHRSVTDGKSHHVLLDLAPDLSDRQIAVLSGYDSYGNVRNEDVRFLIPH